MNKYKHKYIADVIYGETDNEIGVKRHEKVVEDLMKLLDSGYEIYNVQTSSNRYAMIITYVLRKQLHGEL